MRDWCRWRLNVNGFSPARSGLIVCIFGVEVYTIYVVVWCPKKAVMVVPIGFDTKELTKRFFPYHARVVDNVPSSHNWKMFYFITNGSRSMSIKNYTRCGWFSLPNLKFFSHAVIFHQCVSRKIPNHRVHYCKHWRALSSGRRAVVSMAAPTYPSLRSLSQHPLICDTSSFANVLPSRYRSRVTYPCRYFEMGSLQYRSLIRNANSDHIQTRLIPRRSPGPSPWVIEERCWVCYLLW